MRDQHPVPKVRSLALQGEKRTQVLEADGYAVQWPLQTAALGKLSIEPTRFFRGFSEEHYDIRFEKSVPTSLQQRQAGSTVATSNARTYPL